MAHLIQINMAGSIGSYWFETEAEALDVYTLVKKALGTYDPFPMRNKESEACVEFNTCKEDGSKATVQLAAIQSVSISADSTPDWYIDVKARHVMIDKKIRDKSETL